MPLLQEMRSFTTSRGQAFCCSGKQKQPQVHFSDLCCFRSFFLVDVAQCFTAQHNLRCNVWGRSLGWSEDSYQSLLCPVRSGQKVGTRDKAVPPPPQSPSPHLWAPAETHWWQGHWTQQGGTAQNKHIALKGSSLKKLLPQEAIRRKKAFRAYYQFKHWS